MAASEHLRADLEERRGSPLVKGGRLVVNLALMAVGAGHDNIADVDLVVRRLDSGGEVMRTPADVGDPDVLLVRVRRDLEEKTVEEFIAEWRLPDDPSA